MKYIKPHYYDTFCCLAGECLDTCCAGWQIYIDDESLEYYSSIEGAFGNRLVNSIDWEEGAFLQENRHCAFLNEDNLCDLHAELGENALCDTCCMYPRHVEEFDGVREYSLSLSCPEAVRIMLTCSEKIQFLVQKTEEPDDSFEEGEMDAQLFEALNQARMVVFDVLQNHRISLESRMNQVLELAEQLQEGIDNNCLELKMDEVLSQYRNGYPLENESGTVIEHSNGENDSKDRKNSNLQVTLCEYIDNSGIQTQDSYRIRYDQRCHEFEVFHEMEILRPEWGKLIKKVWKLLYRSGVEQYIQISSQFTQFLEESPEWKTLWNRIGENLMIFFINTYFCGAVYDEEVLSKVKLAVFSVHWIQELVMYCYWNQDRTLAVDDVIRMAWYYAREVEHSDVNLEILENWLQENPI